MARYLKDHQRVVLEYKSESTSTRSCRARWWYGRIPISQDAEGKRLEIEVRRSRHSRCTLLEDAHPDAGDDRFIWGGVGVIWSTFKDLGLEAEAQVNTDSCAARSFSFRRGAGEFDRWRHLSWGCRREFADESCLSSRFMEKTTSPTA